MRPHQVSPELKKFICDGLILIRNSNYEQGQKAQLLRRLLSLGAGADWTPLKITLGALTLIAKNDFKQPKGIERAHLCHQRETISKLLEEGKWGRDDWWDWFEERDYTVLATRSENRNEKKFSSLKKFPIPQKLNLFSGKTAGFVYKSEEIKFLRNLAAQQRLI
jgi:hypothetical protein